VVDGERLVPNILKGIWNHEAKIRAYYGWLMRIMVVVITCKKLLVLSSGRYCFHPLSIVQPLMKATDVPVGVNRISVWLSSLPSQASPRKKVPISILGGEPALG
jgi:hypothetical protein